MLAKHERELEEQRAKDEAKQAKLQALKAALDAAKEDADAKKRAKRHNHHTSRNTGVAGDDVKLEPRPPSGSPPISRVTRAVHEATTESRRTLSPAPPTGPPPEMRRPQPESAGPRAAPPSPPIPTLRKAARSHDAPARPAPEGLPPSAAKAQRPSGAEPGEEAAFGVPGRDNGRVQRTPPPSLPGSPRRVSASSQESPHAPSDVQRVPSNADTVAPEKEKKARVRATTTAVETNNSSKAQAKNRKALMKERASAVAAKKREAAMRAAAEERKAQKAKMSSQNAARTKERKKNAKKPPQTKGRGSKDAGGQERSSYRDGVRRSRDQADDHSPGGEEVDVRSSEDGTHRMDGDRRSPPDSHWHHERHHQHHAAQYRYHPEENRQHPEYSYGREDHRWHNGDYHYPVPLGHRLDDGYNHFDGHPRPLESHRRPYDHGTYWGPSMRGPRSSWESQMEPVTKARLLSQLSAIKFSLLRKQSELDTEVRRGERHLDHQQHVFTANELSRMKAGETWRGKKTDGAA